MVSNVDGVNPYGGLVLSGNTLYGTTDLGGPSGLGTVFKVNTDGTGFTSLYNFAINDVWNPYTERLILSGTTLYGTGCWGGSYNWGGVFAINTDGTGFRNLYFSTKAEGAFPYSGVLLADKTLYGTAEAGGDFGGGSIFRINTDGTDFTNLYSFSGAQPVTGLVLSGNTLYGAARGGEFGYGTVFAVNIDGTGYRQVHAFTGGNDGEDPSATPFLANNVLYGTTEGAWPNGRAGTVFRVNTDGTGFQTLHTFSGNDGRCPVADLILSGNVLYGTTRSGGAFDAGIIFAINVDGTGFRKLYQFTGGDDGAFLLSGLILTGNALYGTASQGGSSRGSSGNGTIFRFSLEAPPPPRLSIIPSGTSCQIMWPTNVNGFILQSAANLAATTVWTPVSIAPVVIDGQNTVTIPCERTQRYFRLAQ